MKLIYCITACIMCALFSVVKINAQHINELELTDCSYDPGVGAEIISDKGESFFVEKDGTLFLRFKHTRKIKIFNESAFDEANISIELRKNKDNIEKVKNIKAVSYNVGSNGVEVSTLLERDIHTEDINKYWYQKKFAIPNVKEGSIIEYSYEITSPFITQFRDWEFQSHLPCRYSEYKVKMVPFYSYRFRAQEIETFDVQKSYEAKGLMRRFAGLEFRDMVYEFALNNIKSYKDEDYVSSVDDYKKRIEFQLAEINYPNGYSKMYMDSWPALSNELLDDISFGKYITKSKKQGSKMFTSLIELDDQAKVDTILNYMKHTYKANGFLGKYAEKDFKTFIKQKEGNTANINLMALGYLMSLGVDVKPLLISTRTHGKVKDEFPYSATFNNVIILAKIDDTYMYLDATNSRFPNNLVPQNNINGKGFIVEEDKEGWAVVNTDKASLKSTNLKYVINSNGEVKGSVFVKNSRYEAIKSERKYNRDLDDFIKDIESNGVTVTGDIEFKNKLDKNKSVSYEYPIEFTTTVIDSQIIVNPFVNYPMSTNPFKQKDRVTSIDLIYPRTHNYSVVMEIPDGYKIEQIPEAVQKNNKNILLNYNVSINNNMLSISMIYQTKKSMYPASDYKELQQFMKTVISTLNKKIVFVPDSNELALEAVN